jgi:hypothetical protein
MQIALAPTKDVLDVLIQLLVLVIPIVISWFIRTYVRASAVETDLAAIVRLSNAAIDYVENLDKRGELVLPPEVKKGGYKLKLAAQWLEAELKRAGVKMTEEQAEKWISSEFQKRVGDVRPVATIAELTRAAVDLIQDLERSKLVELPSDVDRTTYLAGLAADWVVAELAKRGANVSREEALTWVRAELLQRLQAQIGELPADDRLAKLATAAVEFLERLKASGQLAVRPGTPGESIETDVATAWLLTEAARQGLAVTSDQIAEAVTIALRQRNHVSA